VINNKESVRDKRQDKGRAVVVKASRVINNLIASSNIMRIGHWIPVIMLCASLGWVRGAQGETQRSERIWQTDPIVLKDVDFDKLVNGSSMWMIDLYSPWYVIMSQLCVLLRTHNKNNALLYYCSLK
jgi:hypothetical protein